MKGWSLEVIVCVIALGMICNADLAHAGGVEDLLYEKGQITKEEGVKLKADREREEGIIQQRSATQKWFDRSVSEAIPNFAIVTSLMRKICASMILMLRR